MGREILAQHNEKDKKYSIVEISPGDVRAEVWKEDRQLDFDDWTQRDMNILATLFLNIQTNK